MTVSINSTFDTITITSSLLETPWVGITSVILTVKKECSTSVDLTIEEGDITGSGSYSFTKDDTGFDFDQQVYGFTLKVTSGAAIEYEYYCFLVDKDLSCRVKSVVAKVDEYSTEDRMQIMLLYYVLTQPNTCHKSSCKDYCTIFNELDNELSMLKC